MSYIVEIRFEFDTKAKADRFEELVDDAFYTVTTENNEDQDDDQ